MVYEYNVLMHNRTITCNPQQAPVSYFLQQI